ncbi:NUDIX hydrolase [Paenibacillus eucommiae]|uniref:8-oxo-dGTP pyrophosphatase MutT (NUDIX family) n=1 Tax=Paenibacillus eucommiae TaxID=1355755 RepID=A0ABS4J0T5_9BACL|nr:NUDIX domain-containing protein [Paenibacillus eucommiae]MBP1992866.1 8-oxo-dGTP pyrophosphatase MutT (NUDIX family) [Paenibacillus eucommiae]
MKEISAGGVVFRREENGALQVQMIQDRYGKITLAKGKMEPGETVGQTALREIWEETGITGSLGELLEVIMYQYSNANSEIIDKEVHYYLVEAISGELQAQVEEIRGVEWLEPLDAWQKQQQAGYDNNDSVLRKALQILGFEVE